MTSPTPDADGHTVSPDVGALVVDRRNGKVGVVMGHVGPYVQLRPPHGGREWDVPPEDVRYADSGGGVEREGGRGQQEVGTVTPRSVLRYETWTLQPNREPDAEPVLYTMQCAVDGETSPTSEDFAEPQDWVLRHCAQNPSHHTYREIISRPWRTWRQT